MPIFIVSHYMSMATISCHSNQSSYPIGTKQYYSFPLPIDAMCEIWPESASWLQRRCRLKMLTDDDDDGRTDDDDGRTDDDDGRTTDAWLYYKLTHEPSAQVS